MYVKEILLAKYVRLNAAAEPMSFFSLTRVEGRYYLKETLVKL